MMSIEEINAQREAIAAQLKQVNGEIAKVAKAEARQVASVAGLGVKFYAKDSPTRHYWTDAEVTLMKTYYKQLGPARMMREMLHGISYSQIATKAQRLNLT